MEIVIGIILFVIEMYLINYLRNFTEKRASFILSLIIMLFLILLMLSSNTISFEFFVAIFIAFAWIYGSCWIGFKLANAMDPDSKIGYIIMFDIFVSVPLYLLKFLVSFA